MTTSPRTHGCGRRAALTSLATSTTELAALAACATVLSGWWLVAARWLIGLTGSCVGYVVNRRWVFRQRGPRGPQFRRFAITLFSAVSLATFLFALAVALLEVDARVLHVATAAFVFATFTRPLLTRWVFPRPS